jgi:hypothetical protein
VDDSCAQGTRAPRPNQHRNDNTRKEPEGHVARFTAIVTRVLNSDQGTVEDLVS